MDLKKLKNKCERQLRNTQVDVYKYIETLEATNDSKPTDASDVAFNIGDTFIDFRNTAPKDQWIRIFEMLKENGYVVRLA